MSTISVALISSLPSEENPLDFHYQLQKIGYEKYGMKVDLLKNGEFVYSIKENQEKPKLYYSQKPFDPGEYNLALARLAIKAAHGGDHYVLREFQNSQVPVINPCDALLKAKDKLHTLQRLSIAGLPVTPTAVIRKREEIGFALSLLGKPPYIIKSPFGSGGSSVLQASTSAQVFAIFDYAWHIDRNEILLIQSYLGEETAQDVRSLYFNYKPWRAMVRQASQGEFRANVKIGANTEITMLTQEEQNICYRAARETGLVLAGIDFLRTNHGPVILEVNGCPGLMGIASAYQRQNIDIIDEFALLLLDYAKNTKTASR